MKVGAGAGPSPRLFHASAATNDGIVIFGGGSWPSGAPLEDTWTLRDAQWSQISTATHPSTRARSAMAAMSGGKALLFGGAGGASNFGDTPLGDTWEWTGTAWRLRAPVHRPSPRFDHAMAYDPVRDRVLLVGGFDGVRDLTEAWEWDGADWTPISPLVGRHGHAMTYNPDRNTIMVTGGKGATGETWEWDGASWTQLGSMPGPDRYYHAMAFDPRFSAVVVFGGSTSLSDAMRFDGSWSALQLAPESAIPGEGVRTEGWRLETDGARGQSYLMGLGSDGSMETWQLFLGPVVVLDSAPPAFSSGHDASFTFHATEPTSFECSVDAGSFTACASPYQLHDVGDGAHEFAVRISAASNTERASWVVDSTPPEVSIERPREGVLYVADQEVAEVPIGQAVVVGEVRVRAIATEPDHDLDLDSFRFFVDAAMVDPQLVETAGDGSFSFLYRPADVGTHRVKAEIRNEAGLSAGGSVQITGAPLAP